MPTGSRKRRRLAYWLGYVGSVIITALVGCTLLLDSTRLNKHEREPSGNSSNLVQRLLLPVTDWFSGASYDLPFLVAGTDDVPLGLVLVLIDSAVKANLGQPTDFPLDRRLHAQFLDHLTAEGAALVVYDLIFDRPSDDGTDLELADAVRRNGRVVLAGDYLQQVQVGAKTGVIIPPIAVLVQAAVDWGPATILSDPDLAIRKLDAGLEDKPSLAWVAAVSLNAPITQSPRDRLRPRWLNYICAPDNLDAVNFDHALKTNGLPTGYFRNKIVVVGSRPSVAAAGAAREEFLSPFSRFGGRYASGPAVQAFSIINLVRGDWLIRLAPAKETALILIWAVIISAVLLRMRPWIAAVAAAMGAVLFAMAASYLQIRHYIWFAWMVPVAAQTATALVWSIGFQYAVERRRQRRLRHAFAAYLSPYMANRIAESDFDLSLGGKEVEATVMFADLEGFTKLSESLTPTELSRVLTAYFNQTTGFILDQNATIIKYIGDAVLAAWGVPLAEPRHAERAVLAAWGMSQASKQAIEGRLLRTRIGVSTGLVLAGNLGSKFRFDYTVIGDTTNFASRLEGLNKHLGTDVLISESTQRQLGDNIKLRPLGNFIVSGKKQPVGIFEVLGPAENFPTDPEWLLTFGRALDQFIRRELDAAEKSFREVIAQRDDRDGPSEFYLGEIARARHQAGAVSWDGTIRLGVK